MSGKNSAGSVRTAKGKECGLRSRETVEPRKQKVHANSVAIAGRGIKEVSDYTQSMIAIFTEVLRGNITPQVCNAAVGAGSRAMRSVEMELRYGNEFRKTFRSHMSGVIDVESGAPAKASRRRKAVKP